MRKLNTLLKMEPEMRSLYLVSSAVCERGQSGRSVPWKTILDLDFLVSFQLGISATRVASGPSTTCSILGPSVFHWGR
jgi:hypothetical protein